MKWVHLSILLLTACVIAYADHLGMAYMRGKKETIPRNTIRTLHYSVWAGLIGMISTGLYMASDRLQYLLKEPAFELKMFFVLVLVVNALFIGRLSLRASEAPYALLATREKIILGVSAAASFIGWVGAATLGRFFI